MWPPNTIKKPNLAFVIPTFNIVFPKEKKSFAINELDMENIWTKVGYNYIWI